MRIQNIRNTGLVSCYSCYRYGITTTTTSTTSTTTTITTTTTTTTTAAAAAAATTTTTSVFVQTDYFSEDHSILGQSPEGSPKRTSLAGARLCIDADGLLVTQRAVSKR